MIKQVKKIKTFILKWNELITIPFGLLLWYMGPVLIRWTGFDETAGQYDSAVLMKIVFAITATAIISGFAWIFIKFAFPKAYKYLDEALGNNLEDNCSEKNMSKWERTKTVLWLLSLYLVVLAYLVNAI